MTWYTTFYIAVGMTTGLLIVIGIALVVLRPVIDPNDDDEHGVL